MGLHSSSQLSRICKHLVVPLAFLVTPLSASAMTWLVTMLVTVAMDRMRCPITTAQEMGCMTCLAWMLVSWLVVSSSSSCSWVLEEQLPGSEPADRTGEEYRFAIFCFIQEPSQMIER
jgi:hypothetical protein